MSGDAFDRVNLDDVVLEPTIAHGGVGTIRFARLIDNTLGESGCNFVDLAVVPPGASIGRHRHDPDQEEFYLVLDGVGAMRRDGEDFAVRTGDLIRNRPGGEHELRNDGERPLRLFVFEVSATPTESASP